MKILDWALRFFGETKEIPRLAKRVKFIEGTEWVCLRCHKTLGVAKRDIYFGDTAASSEWAIADEGFWTHKHCGEFAARLQNGRIEFHTPTGWVG